MAGKIAKRRQSAVLYDQYRQVWELWNCSRPVVESRDRERVLEWAASQGYSVVGQ